MGKGLVGLFILKVHSKPRMLELKAPSVVRRLAGGTYLYHYSTLKITQVMLTCTNIQMQCSCFTYYTKADTAAALVTPFYSQSYLHWWEKTETGRPQKRGESAPGTKAHDATSFTSLPPLQDHESTNVCQRSKQTGWMKSI